MAARAVLFPVSVVIHFQRFRIFLRHPVRRRHRRRAQDRVNAVFVQAVHKLMQPAKIKDAVVWFHAAPGKLRNAHRIEAAFFHHRDILFKRREILSVNFGVKSRPHIKFFHITPPFGET